MNSPTYLNANCILKMATSSACPVPAVGWHFGNVSLFRRKVQSLPQADSISYLERSKEPVQLQRRFQKQTRSAHSAEHILEWPVALKNAMTGQQIINIRHKQIYEINDNKKRYSPHIPSQGLLSFGFNNVLVTAYCRKNQQGRCVAEPTKLYIPLLPRK
jgi:hypothetical protein